MARYPTSLYPSTKLLVAVLVVLLTQADNARSWSTVPTFRRYSTALHATLPATYREIGESLILRAGEECGAAEGQLSVEWKGDKIIVTVRGDSYVSDPIEDGDGGGDAENLGIDDVESDQVLSATVGEPKGVDVTELARAINRILDDDDVGLAIAENHSIEVTTPGASDELTGIMFEAYKGFDIICHCTDPKTNKQKQIEGRLVERNDEVTIINIKGRMKKVKNDDVVSVRLPKAKKEKGVK